MSSTVSADPISASSASRENESPDRDSIGIPVYKECEGIRPLYERLNAMMNALPYSCECVLVDDGSTDDSLRLLREIAQVDRRIVAVGLRQNAGKSLALSTAFSVAKGDFIITMDGDLQHDPADRPRLAEKLEEGFDIVGGRRLERTDSLPRRLSNRCANWVLGKVTGVHLHDWGSGFQAFPPAPVSRFPI